VTEHWGQRTGATQKGTIWPRKHLQIEANKKAQTEKQQTLPVTLGHSFGNLLHLERRGTTSFECRFLEEFEESLIVLVKTAFFFFELFRQSNKCVHMFDSPYLHVSMPFVDELTELPALLLPIFPLTSLGTV
jgi:hypothetical protein